MAAKPEKRAWGRHGIWHDMACGKDTSTREEIEARSVELETSAKFEIMTGYDADVGTMIRGLVEIRAKFGETILDAWIFPVIYTRTFSVSHARTFYEIIMTNLALLLHGGLIGPTACTFSDIDWVFENKQLIKWLAAHDTNDDTNEHNDVVAELKLFIGATPGAAVKGAAASSE